MNYPFNAAYSHTRWCIKTEKKNWVGSTIRESIRPAPDQYSSVCLSFSLSHPQVFCPLLLIWISPHRCCADWDGGELVTVLFYSWRTSMSRVSEYLKLLLVTQQRADSLQQTHGQKLWRISLLAHFKHVFLLFLCSFLTSKLTSLTFSEMIDALKPGYGVKKCLVRQPTRF